jgi:hypothetical protein
MKHATPKNDANAKGSMASGGVFRFEMEYSNDEKS